MSAPLTFRNSYPQVLLPPGALRRLHATAGRSAAVPAAAAGFPQSTWLIGVVAIALVTVSWPIGVAMVVAGLLWLWFRNRRQQRTPRPSTVRATREDRQQLAMTLLPEGDAREGRFDRFLAQLVSAQVRGLLICRLGPHLEPLCQLNRYPDLVMVTETGILIAVEVDEPWHWNGRQRVLSHDAEADEARTQELLAKGLVMVRLAEQQVAERPVDCIQLLQAVTDRVWSGMTPDTNSFYRALPWPCRRM